MSKYRRYFKVNLIILVTLFIVVLALLNNSIRSIPIFDNTAGSSVGKIYYLKPMDFSSLPDYSTIKFAQADISPLENSYKREIQKEDKLVRLEKDEPINFASKRVTEIYQWGNVLKINRNIEIDDNPQNYNTWEYLIRRYVLLVDEQLKIINSSDIPNLDKSEIISQLYGVINYHYQNILQIIYSTNKTPEEKQYLISLTNNAILAKLNELKPLLVSFEQYRTIYSLKEISDNNDWGVYQITLPSNGSTSGMEKLINLSINNSTFSGILKQSAYGSNGLSFGNIEINNEQDILSLFYPKTDTLNLQGWSEAKSTDNDFDYSLVLPLEKTEKYFLSFNVDFPYDIYFKIEDSYFDNLSNVSKTSSLLSNSWIYFNKENKGNFSQMVPIEKKSPSYTVRMFFRTKQKMETSDLNKLSLQWVPIYNSYLKLEKIKENSSDLLNVSTKRHGLLDYVITVKKYIALLVVLFLFLFFQLKISNKIFDKLLDLLKIQFSKISTKTKGAVEKHTMNLVKTRWWTLSIFLLLFMLGIARGQGASNKLFTVAIVVWLLIVLGWRLEARFSLAFSVILLTFCAIFRSVKIIGAAEWAAIWSYLFLFASILQIIFLEWLIKSGNKFEKFVQSVKFICKGALPKN